MNEIKTLAEALPYQIQRCTKLVGRYKEIGPNGAFGAMMIQRDIDAAIKACAEGDLVAMIRCCKALQECN